MDDDDRDYVGSVPFPTSIEAVSIGRIHSPWRQRHGTPRQPGLTSAKEGGEVDGSIELFPEVVAPESLRHLETFDWIWIVSWFHLNGSRRRPLVRPPRGGEKRGVFATRSPHRPNPIGLSAVQLLGVEGTFVHVRGLDLLDGTPVLDIKPYIPDFDARPEARRGWLDGT